MKLRSILIAMLLLAKILNGSAAETNAPASSVPKFEVRAYRLEGDTALLPEPDGVISNYTGQVDLARLHEGLDQLLLFYRRSCGQRADGDAAPWTFIQPHNMAHLHGNARRARHSGDHAGSSRPRFFR